MAGESITRTKEEALAKAKDLTKKLKAAPDTFAEVAKVESDGPSAPRGGSLGSWQKGRMVPAFDDAIELLEVGAITDEPVETQFGYHVIKREPTKKKFYSAYAFIIASAGPQLPPTVTRTREQADSLANSLKGKVNTANFEEMAATYNDLLDKPVFLGAFTADNNLPDGLLEAVEGLKYGEVAGPIEFPIGYAFVRRAKTEQLAGSHILIGYAGAERAPDTVTRSKAEADDLASEVASELASDPTQFEALAAENSDDSSGQLGGSLGVWFKGSMVSVFDSTVASLDIGQISGSIESPFGYHIIRRDSIPQ
jgi:parvulin-like peptidyl-prolyl isomerase